MKERVFFIGFQEMEEDKPSVALVNNAIGSTVQFDSEKHKIINIDDWLRERPQRPYDNLRAQEIRNHARNCSSSRKSCQDKPNESYNDSGANYAKHTRSQHDQL